MSDRARFFLLIFLMTFVSLVGVGITIYTLYTTALNEERLRLIETVQSRARMMEAVAQFDTKYGQEFPNGPVEATISQVIEAHKNFTGFGETGEYVLARRDGDQIIFILSHRHMDLNQPLPVSFNSIIAEPMRQVLMGNSGSIIGLDYRGEIVLAAYEPIKELNLGLVAKIDMVEIRAPFIKAGILAIIISIILVLAGAFIFRRVVNPIIIRLREQSVYLENQVEKRTNELRKSESKFRNIFERSMDALYITDSDGNIMEINEAGIVLFGYSRVEWRNRKVQQAYVRPEQRYEFINLLEKNNYLSNYSVQYEHKNGSVIDCLESAILVKSDEGDIIGYQGIIRDITEEKRQRKEIERMAQFPGLNPLPVIEIDKKGKITYINSPGEVLIKKLNDPNTATDQILPKDYINEAINCLAGGKDVPSKEIQLNGSVYLWNGKSVPELNAVHFYATDITNLKKVEKNLIQAKELAENANRVKSLFLANMSHEIRTPLNTLLGFTDVIEESTRHAVNEEERGFFNVIKTSGERLMHTVHEILDISQIEAGTYVKKIEDYNLVVMVQELVDGQQINAEEKHLILEFHSTQKQILVRGDRYGIFQSINNIIDNAIKYTEKGKITIDLRQKSKSAILTIQDTGIGMSQEYLNKLFEVFTQESEGYTKKYQGIGLGMSIVKRHLDINQVEIAVDSIQGKGTTFTLAFPKPEKIIIPNIEEKKSKKSGAVYSIKTHTEV